MNEGILGIGQLPRGEHNFLPESDGRLPSRHLTSTATCWATEPTHSPHTNLTRWRGTERLPDLSRVAQPLQDGAGSDLGPNPEAASWGV